MLVERARGGDASAFGELYARHHDAIYRYIAFRVSDTSDAEDLTGHVFLRAWEALPSYEPRGYRFTSWLYRIAHNLVADHHRGRGAFVAAPLEASADVPEAQQPTTLERVIAAEEAAMLTRAVAQLPAEQRQVVLLRFVHGMSHIDIAQRLAKSQGASRVILHRALATLNQMLRSSLVAVLAVLMLIGGVVYAARNAHPGEPLYVVRSAVETVRQALPALQPAPPTATPPVTATPTFTPSPRLAPAASPAPLIVAPLPPTWTPSIAPSAGAACCTPTRTPTASAPSATVPIPSVTPSATTRVEPPSVTSSVTAVPAPSVQSQPRLAAATLAPMPTRTSTLTLTPIPTLPATPTSSATFTPSNTPSPIPTATLTPSALSTPPSATETPTSSAACCDATAQPTSDDQRLRLAIAIPSRPLIYGGETFTVAVVLAHRGNTVDGPVRVVLVLPDELRYVEGSAERGGTYDAATRTVVWAAAQLPPRSELHVSVQLTADAVTRPVVVRLAVRVRVGVLVATRDAVVALVPERTPTPMP